MKRTSAAQTSTHVVSIDCMAWSSPCCASSAYSARAGTRRGASPEGVRAVLAGPELEVRDERLSPDFPGAARTRPPGHGGVDCVIRTARRPPPPVINGELVGDP